MALWASCFFQSLSRKDSSVQEKLSEASSALAQLEEYQQLEVTLRDQISALEQEKSELSSKVSSELEGREKKYEEDMEAFREQNKQHSVTICAMEERLIKLMKKNKDYQEEITCLKKTIQGLYIHFSAHYLYIASVNVIFSSWLFS